MRSRLFGSVAPLALPLALACSSAGTVGKNEGAAGSGTFPTESDGGSGIEGGENGGGPGFGGGSSTDDSGPFGGGPGSEGGLIGQGDGGPCLPACAKGEVCLGGKCIPDLGTCAGGEPCLSDSSCVSDQCVPFETPPLSDRDEECKREPAPLDHFEPVVKCEWPGTFTVTHDDMVNVLVPPLVADLDGDDVPEIVFVSSGNTAASWGAGGGVLRAIRGDDCSPVWDYDDQPGRGQTPAIGDLDGDGKPEVCSRGDIQVGDCVPFCVDGAGKLLWKAHDAASKPVTVDCKSEETGVSMVDVDQDGKAELVVGLTVIDATGLVVKATPSPVPGGGTGNQWSGPIPALADVDGDGHVDAMTGDGVFDLLTGTKKAWTTPAGYTAVAEISPDHDGPEVVTVDYPGNTIRVQAQDGTVLYTHIIPGSAGGPPTIADLDGDGHAEFSTAANDKLTAFDLDCTASPPPGGDCGSGSTDGILWSVPTQEKSSGFTGSTVFDFEGDGPVEVVYADECWARVYDGKTGDIKFSGPHESGTALEYPTIADVDGDFFTEMVVPHNSFDWLVCPDVDPYVATSKREAGRTYRGLTVFADAEDRWSPSRPVWNQHTYHVSNINDDLSIPKIETPSWTTHNSYRRQLPSGTGIDTPDLTVGPVGGPDCDDKKRVQELETKVCNRGTLPVKAGEVVSLHLDDAKGDVLCTATTKNVLEPGKCEAVSCTWTDVPLNEEHDISAVVDEAEEIPECHEDNDEGRGHVRCPPKTVK